MLVQKISAADINSSFVVIVNKRLNGIFEG